MLDDVTVIVWGEFGRTPRINKQRRPRPLAQVSCALLAGGGMQGRPGHRRHQSPRRRSHRAARPLSGNLRHALPQPRHRRLHRPPHRSRRPAAIPRRNAADPRIGLIPAAYDNRRPRQQHLDAVVLRVGQELDPVVAALEPRRIERHPAIDRVVLAGAGDRQRPAIEREVVFARSPPRRPTRRRAIPPARCSLVRYRSRSCTS